MIQPPTRQIPGVYHRRIGDIVVTALSDGTVPLAVDTLLTNTSPAKVKKALDRWFLKEPVDISVNAYLINTGTKLVLVDAGAGALFGRLHRGNEAVDRDCAFWREIADAGVP